MDKAITIKLKDYDTLVRVLQQHDYWTALSIDQGNQSKHDKLMELLQHKVVLQFINENF